MTKIDRDLSRRSVIAGLGGMAFCIAVGNDGVRLMSQAQANALANAPITPWVRIAPDGGLVERRHRMGPARRQGLRLQGSVRH
jgi:hypothetical protein